MFLIKFYSSGNVASMTTSGDGLGLPVNSSYFIVKNLLVGLLLLTNLFMAKHFVSYSKINLVTNNDISKIKDHRALSHTL